MAKTDAERRKAEDEIADKVHGTLHVLMDGVRTAMVNSEERENEHQYRYDGYGRLRDREIGYAVKLGSVSAQLAGAFTRLRAGVATREK